MHGKTIPRNGKHGIKLRFRRQLTKRLVSLGAQALNEHHHVMRKRYLLAEPADIAIDEFVPDLYPGVFDKAGCSAIAQNTD